MQNKTFWLEEEEPDKIIQVYLKETKPNDTNSCFGDFYNKGDEHDRSTSDND